MNVHRATVASIDHKPWAVLRQAPVVMLAAVQAALARREGN